MYTLDFFVVFYFFLDSLTLSHTLLKNEFLELQLILLHVNDSREAIVTIQ